VLLSQTLLTTGSRGGTRWTPPHQTPQIPGCGILHLFTSEIASISFKIVCVTQGRGCRSSLGVQI
jgi:hypothetical protein